MKYLSLSLCCLSLVALQPLHATITFKSKSSTIKVDDGASLELVKKIQNCTGKVIKESGSMIDGQDIEFNAGLFEEGANSLDISGNLTPGSTNRITLNGNKTFRGIKGNTLQLLRVSGNNNRVEGSVELNSNMELFDSSSSVTCAIVRKLSRDIEMNGGTIYLEENLGFVDGKKLTGPGHVIGNGRKIVLGTKEMTWDTPLSFEDDLTIVMHGKVSLAHTWTVSAGANVIAGNNNILELSGIGKIFVDAGAQLHLKDVVIKGLSGQNIVCAQENSKVTFQNVAWIQDADFTFDKGSFDVYGLLDMYGSSVFAYQSKMTSTVHANAVMCLESNFTFSYDPSRARKDLLHLDDGGTLHLKGATLHTTITGMKLTKGNFVIDGKSNLNVETRLHDVDHTAQEAKIEFGNNLLADDLKCTIMVGAHLNLTNGELVYKNTDADSWKMLNVLSGLKLSNDTRLTLEQTLNLGVGRLLVEPTASLSRKNGSEIIGSIEFLK
ncbi:MAG: hypothetical protein H6679_06040 [Epsilonproteobacteria bacterium]|nr:hypothetical protein [Campylobacterota bacterium]